MCQEKVTQISIAEMYGVTQQTISDIVSLRRRRHETWQLPA
jgi:hypothetical protein